MPGGTGGGHCRFMTTQGTPLADKPQAACWELGLT